MAGWNQWPKKQPSKDQKEWPKGGKGKGAVQPQSQKDKKELPAYDSTSTAPSGSSSSQSSSKDGALKTALVEILAENKLQIPEHLKHIMEDDVTERINLDQRRINSQRKLSSKLDRLKKASAKKDEQWTMFRNQMREHWMKEQERYTQEKQEIKDAIAQTQLELDKMMKGEMEDEELPQSKEPMDILEELTTETPMKATPMQRDTQQMPEIIKQTQEDHQKLMTQMGELQQQMLYMVQVMSSPAIGSPARTDLPVAMMTPPKVPPLGKRTALEPFSRRGNEQSTRQAQDGHSRSPKRTPTRTTMEGANGAINVEQIPAVEMGSLGELDGYGST